MSEKGDYSRPTLAERTKPARVEICPSCGGAGLHRSRCPDRPCRAVPTVLAAAFAMGRAGPAAWDGFQDAIKGVVL